MNSAVNTKEKIIEVAIELFAEKGYGQTSVRELAKKADVNLSAINYHFESKEGLYAEIMKYSFENFESGISTLDTSLTFEDYVIEYYRYFRTHSTILKNVFKLFIFDTVKLDNAMEIHKDQKVVGPPGANALVEILLKEIQKDLSITELHYAVDTVATLVFHKALIQCAGKIEHMKEEMEGSEMGELFTEETVEKNIRRTVRLVLTELCS